MTRKFFTLDLLSATVRKPVFKCVLKYINLIIYKYIYR